MKLSRWVYTVLGLGFVGLGLIGLAVPGLPTTGFMIIALFCFKKGSARLEAWLLNHKKFGPTLRDWDENRAIRRRTKIVAIVSMWIFSAVSGIFVEVTWFRISLAVLCCFGTWYIVTRKTVEDLPVDVRSASGTCA
jgi:uncharacterized membrane protein YbaN (DUF454 family)